MVALLTPTMAITVLRVKEMDWRTRSSAFLDQTPSTLFNPTAARFMTTKNGKNREPSHGEARSRTTNGSFMGFASNCLLPAIHLTDEDTR